MAKTNKQINKEADVSDSDSSPAVVAYRVGRLEETITNGFKEHNEKLDKLANNFITKEEFKGHDTRITVLERARSKNWVFNTLSALAGGLFIFLIEYALTH
jgi:hypothetical protein